jgi:carboxymethylenebutenolidase
MGQMIELTASDGETFSAYRVEPEGTPKGGVVVIQEIWGVNSHIRSVADGYAAEGYLVIAPALFDRVDPAVKMDDYNDETMKTGFATMQKVDIDKALLDVQAAVNAASEAGKVGVIGFCFGGRMTWLSASRLDGIAAAAPYYGGGIPGHASEQPKCPIILHFGGADDHIPLDTVEEFQKSHPTLPVHIYDGAEHGFNCDRRASFHPAASKLARERTLALLGEHVG